MLRRCTRWVALTTFLTGLMIVFAACGATQSAAPSSGSVSGKEGSTQAPAANGARIAVEEESFDFGKVPLDKVVSHTFKIKNVGNAPLVLNGEPPVRAVQGC